MVGGREGKAIGTASKLELIFFQNGLKIRSANEGKKKLKSALSTPKGLEMAVGRSGVAKGDLKTESGYSY